MTTREVTIDKLLEVREQLFEQLPATLDDAERKFLLSINRCEPDGAFIAMPGIENLPALKWKQLNLQKLAKSNRTKFNAMTAALNDVFETVR